MEQQTIYQNYTWLVLQGIVTRFRKCTGYSNRETLMPFLPYAIHTDDHGRALILNRQYLPLGITREQMTRWIPKIEGKHRVDYQDPQFDPMRIPLSLMDTKGLIERKPGVWNVCTGREFSGNSRKAGRTVYLARIVRIFNLRPGQLSVPEMELPTFNNQVNQ